MPASGFSTPILVLLCTTLLVFFACKNDDSPKASAPKDPLVMPADAEKAEISVSDFNCWTELNMFIITGICNNESADWQRIWLRAVINDKDGKTLPFKGHPDVVFRAFSDAIPPRGRSAFMVALPLSSFGGVPDTCQISGAGAVDMSEGPVLVASDIGGARQLESGTQTETGRKASVKISNPQPGRAVDNLKFEVLLYDQNNRLWMAQVVNPLDSNFIRSNQLLSDGSGPIPGAGSRTYGFNLITQGLPAALQNGKLGRLDFIPFESRGK
jgi:hypothetical protein